MYCFDKSKQVKKVLITLDVTLDSIKYAVKNGFDTIISHHPLIFKPITHLDFEGAVGARLKEIIKHDISVMSFHTRLDCVAVNQCLAESIQLEQVDKYELDGMPLGRVGILKNEMSSDEFAKFIKERIFACGVCYPANRERTIKKVAVLGGSGGDAVSVALKIGADALVTGECSYNKIIDAADCGLSVFTAGHFETENMVCDYLYGVVKELDGDIDCQIYNSGIIANI
jgi:dinuclear metal center YbgI/SA1388 family protein